MTIAQRINYKNYFTCQKYSYSPKSKIVFALRYLCRIRAHLSSKSGAFHSKKRHSNHKRIKAETVLA